LQSISIAHVAITLALSFLRFLSTNTCVAGPNVNLGQNVRPPQQFSLDQIDTRKCDALQNKYVDKNSNVDFTAWKRTTEKVQTLDSFLKFLSPANPDAQATAPPHLAFWIIACEVENDDARLKLNTQVFFAKLGNLRYDSARRTFQISPILKWFGGDF